MKTEALSFWHRVNGAFLLALHNFVDGDFAALFNGYDFVDGLESGQGDINYVVAGAEHELSGGVFLEQAIVDRDLRALGLGPDAHGAHAGGAVASAASEHLLEFADAADFFRVTESA